MWKIIVEKPTAENEPQFPNLWVRLEACKEKRMSLFKNITFREKKKIKNVHFFLTQVIDFFVYIQNTIKYLYFEYKFFNIYLN